MNKNTIIMLIIGLVVLVGGYFIFFANSQVPVQENNQQDFDSAGNSVLEGDTTTKDEMTGGNTTAQNHEVIFTDTGYAPAELKIKAGDTVIFKNQSSSQSWTASAMHPAHSVYSGTSLQSHCPDPENNDFDQCQAGNPGTSWSFTFSKAGTWAYHNHVVAGKFGKIVVE